MAPESPTPSVSKTALWTGWVLTVLPSLLLLFSAVMKLMKAPGLANGLAHFGVPLSQATGLGVLELGCTLLFLVPRTAVLGAILVTGYLGGATAINVRVGDPGYATVVLGVVVWGGLFLRDPRLRALLPLRS